MEHASDRDCRVLGTRSAYGCSGTTRDVVQAHIHGSPSTHLGRDVRVRRKGRPRCPQAAVIITLKAAVLDRYSRTAEVFNLAPLWGLASYIYTGLLTCNARTLSRRPGAHSPIGARVRGEG